MQLPTTEEFDAYLLSLVKNNEYQIETDNNGQILIYTGLYEWENDTIHDKPENEEV